MGNMQFTLGIDIGSTTVKIAILDDRQRILFSDYQRHFANIRETLSALLAEAYKNWETSRFIPLSPVPAV